MERLIFDQHFHNTGEWQMGLGQPGVTTLQAVLALSPFAFRLGGVVLREGSFVIIIIIIIGRRRSRKEEEEEKEKKRKKKKKKKKKRRRRRRRRMLTMLIIIIFIIIIMIIGICKASTLRLKALNKHNMIQIMYIEMENVISNLPKS